MSTRLARPTALLVLISILGACSRSDATATAVEQAATLTPPESAIVVALAQVPLSLDPADHRDRTSETVIRNMFDGLVTRDSRNNVHLELAENLEWLDDHALQVQLRQGVLFHDGVEMTADDIVFTFERILARNGIEYPAPHDSPRQSLIVPLASVEKTDDYSVVMHFDAPWPSAMQMLVHQQIVPKHYLEKVGTLGFIEHPIGTGPYEFVSASADLKEIVMERFEGYYGGAPDLPPVRPACIDRVTFRAIPDASTRAAALTIGEADIIQSVPLEMMDHLDDNPKVALKTVPGTQPKWMEMNVTRPPFDDVRVRQALNYAVDKDRLVKDIYGGRAVALPGPLSPYNNFVSSSLEPYRYEPARAVAMLAQAGWTDTDGDGVLDKTGQRFSFVLDTLQEWQPLAQAVADQFREIGIDALVRTWEASVIRPDLLAGERLAYLDDWGDSAFDPVGHFEAKWHGFIADQPYGRGNFSGYNNERVNELIRLGEITADRDARKEIYEKAQQIIYSEAPAVFLILPEEIEAASTRIQNWEPASDSRINLHDICVTP